MEHFAASKERAKHEGETKGMPKPIFVIFMALLWIAYCARLATHWQTTGNLPHIYAGVVFPLLWWRMLKDNASSQAVLLAVFAFIGILMT